MNLCYGNAFLSRFPITDTETIVFGRRRVGEKGFLFSEIDVGGRVVPIVNLHLHFGSRSRRLVQLDLLVAWLKEKEKERGRTWAIPPIVCGDFNNPDTRDDATSAMLSHLGEYGEYSLHPLGGLTFPSPLPRRALDFIFVPPGCKAVRSECHTPFLPVRPQACHGRVFGGVTGRIAFHRPSNVTDQGSLRPRPSAEPRRLHCLPLRGRPGL